MNEKTIKTKVFVYGTLLKGNYNYQNHLLDATFIAKASLRSYAMYELGTWPGIKANADGVVLGEIYKVDNDTLLKLNELEEEGVTYKLTAVTVEDEKKNIHYVSVYVYLGEVKEENRIPLEEQPYKRTHKIKKV